MPVAVSHIADYCNRYPGESVTLTTRVDVLMDLTALSLGVDVPPGLDVNGFHTPTALLSAVPQVQEIGEGSHIVWTADQPVSKGTRWEFEVVATIKAGTGDGDVPIPLVSEALVLAHTASGEEEEIGTGTIIAVLPKGRYLKYLPSIYREDDLMARLVMLFESFWSPIENQITDIHYLLDPRLTPAALLPWLASWADLALDQRWSEAKQRRLLRSIVSLYRRRGTRQGLEQMLEIYTGERPMILEHRANNLTLGTSARLGPSIALGQGNVPYTFTVTMRLPPVAAPDAPPLSDEDRQRLEAERQRVIESIIESEKPAHTRYTLKIEQV